VARIGLEPVWKGHILAASRLTINWIMAIRNLRSFRVRPRSPYSIDASGCAKRRCVRRSSATAGPESANID
jgi:hypothetical protein